LKRNGTLWGWGLDFNTGGGRGITRTVPVPTQLGPETNWVTISAGDYHLAALRRDGSLWVIGSSVSTMIAGAPNPCTNWIQLGSETNWTEVRSGQDNLLARKTDGSWWSIGNQNGERWNSATFRVGGGFSKLPLTVQPLAMRSQRGTTLLLMPDGRLWNLGDRIGGQPGFDFPSRIARLVSGIARIFGSNIPTADAQPPHDSTPYLIWEAK
jgi:hypothetical protein